MALHMINPQILGNFDPGQQARVKAGQKLTRIWQGEAQQIPANMRGNPRGFARGLAEGLPGLRRLRMAFNIFSFNADGSFHPEMEDFLDEACKAGFEIHWVLADGPSQESGTGLEAHWPSSYSAIETQQDWLDLMPVLRQRHAAAWDALLRWLDMRPDIRTCSFEAINEAASYDRAADRFPGLRPRFVEEYVEAVLAIHDRIAARWPDRDFYVGGWAYSADFHTLADVQLPSGGTALMRFRDRIGERLVWSAHFYPQWGPNVGTVEDYEAVLDRRFAPILGDRVVLTEFNVQNGRVNDPRVADDKDRAHFMIARCGRWFHRHDIGIGWWAAANYAAGFLIMVRGNGGLRQRHQNTFGAAFGLYAYGNPDWLFTGPDSGESPVKVTGIDKASNAETDWDDDPDPLDDVKAYGLGFGGRGLCILRAHDAANNFLYGGDGHNILLGGPMDDHLMTGRGGGVIRTGEGNNIVTTNGGNTRIFCGEGYSLVSVFVGRSTIICDPGGHVWIFGFDPAKGDRISFQGAFDGSEALRKAISVEPADASLKGEENLIVALPGEGEVILQGCGPLADALADHVPDFTEGWYGRGWQEPPDESP